MATSLDVAAYILRVMADGGEDAPITRTVQKLVYYTQAWSLAWDGRPAFYEPIEAWKDGPVVRRLYSAHHRQWRVSEIPAGDPDALTDEEKSIVDAVMAFYGHMSFDQLVDQTHKELPWQRARGDKPPGAHSWAEITQGSMRSFYTVQSLNGLPTPERPQSRSKYVDANEVRDETATQTKVWRETLDWLATR
ncbi:Panacea domain-containing protein [Mycolicibacter minnesotensis]|nr:type II toxin-antitoxin system antitoxin SocA domain-containing protein [Mycolicibacter minnesotensis]BBY33352.1 hypothetical protein MMIN_14130 [Mycolicibacter minnesotensis]